MRLYFSLLLLAALSLCPRSYAQTTTTITGKIIDAVTKAPIEGVSIHVATTRTGTITNVGGEFSIHAKPTDILNISYVGYLAQTINISGRTTINIELETSFTESSQVVLVGSRGGGRIKTETAVPVDIVKIGSNSMPTGRMDLTSIINYSAPSLNYNKQSGSDGADHVDLATLRGLSPDQTLVLVNGKRRHQTAFVAIFGTRGRGASGTDLNALPLGSIDRVEILRDGASAQYGSDAIAGVMNLILKKDVRKFTLDIGYSGYLDTKFNTSSSKNNGQYPYQSKLDGNTVTLNANYGFPLGKHGGFLNLTGNGALQGKTFRQILDPNVLYVNYVRRANGDGSLNSGGGFLNMELPVAGTKTTVYAFGGFNYKKSDAFAFSRSWNSRPDRFPTTASGAISFVPGIMYSVANDDGSHDTVYNPRIQTHIQDASLAAGIRGITAGNWDWDLSNNVGRNDFHYYGDKTFNASLGDAQTHFDDGGFNLLQNTTNLDFSKKLLTVAQGLNIGLGAEYRYERYKIYKGEEASYANYNAEKATGAQGYPGYQPADEVNAHRSVYGAYADLELDATRLWLLGGAVRYEHYSDFGSTTNFKFDTRYKVTHNFNLRGSISTGFRAPSLAQMNFSNTFSNVLGNKILDVKIAPNYSAIARAAGVPLLKQEKSTNASLGFSWKPAKELTITIDGYWVKVKDRVVLSGQFGADDSTLSPTLTNTLKALNVSYAQFFANAVNTTNKGIDVVIDYHKTVGARHFNILLTGNIQHMSIDKINVPSVLNDLESHRKTFLSDREQKFILASAPKAKAGINLEYGIRRFSVGTRFTYFGKIDLLGYGEDGTGVNPMVPTDADENVYVKDEYIYKAKVVSDLYFTYKLYKHATFFIGADNVFNVHPDYGFVPAAKGWAFNNETGGPWDAVQMGFNGRRLYAKLSFSF